MNAVGFLAGPNTDDAHAALMSSSQSSINNVHAHGHGHHVHHETGIHYATDAARASSPSAFLAGDAAKELTSQQMEERTTQLRVAFGISSMTFLMSCGVAGRTIYNVWKRQMDKYDEEERAAAEAAQAEQHEADQGAGGATQLAIKLAAGPRLTVHNLVEEKKDEDKSSMQPIFSADSATNTCTT